MLKKTISYNHIVSFLLLLFLIPTLGSINSQIFISFYEEIFGFEDFYQYTHIQNTQGSIQITGGGYSLYEDPLLGIALRHPSEWQQDVTDKSVSFSKTDNSSTPTMFIFTATVDTLEPKIRTLDQFVRAGVAPYREISGFELTEYDKGATLAGLPAHKVTFYIPYQNVAFSKIVSYFAMLNNTGYGIAYQVSNPEKEELDTLLNSELPTFQRMTNSFQIIS